MAWRQPAYILATAVGATLHAAAVVAGHCATSRAHTVSIPDGMWHMPQNILSSPADTRRERSKPLSCAAFKAAYAQGVVGALALYGSQALYKQALKSNRVSSASKITTPPNTCTCLRDAVPYVHYANSLCVQCRPLHTWAMPGRDQSENTANGMWCTNDTLGPRK